VVIAIIGLLSTLSLVALNVARAKARDALRVADVKQIMTALELYYNDVGHYPKAWFNLSTSGKLATTTNGATSTYIGLIPINPSPTDGRACSTTPNFVYTSDSNSSSYHIAYCLGSNSGAVTGNFVHNATPIGIANP
jgi:type II secretory pathway pseudopilin PulG